MAKRRKGKGENGIRRSIKDGRGQGQGSEYNPWLHIQDVASKGLVTRVKDGKPEEFITFLANRSSGTSTSSNGLRQSLT